MAQTQTLPQLEIVAGDGQVRFVELNPAVGVLNIGQHPDNDIVLDGPGVAPFHAVLDVRSQPFQFLPLDADGSQAQPLELSQWQGVTVGSHRLELVADETTRTAPSAAGPVPAAPASAAGSVGPQWVVQPGLVTPQAVTVQNGGAAPAEFHMQIWADQPGWISLATTALPLPPGGQAAFALEIAPPADAPAGVFALGWRIRSPQYPGWADERQVELVVPSRARLEVAELAPATFRPGLFGRTGRTQLLISNRGNEPGAVQVSAFDALRRVDVGATHVRMRAGDTAGAWQAYDGGNLWLQPGEQAEFRIVTRRRRMRLLGLAVVDHRFGVQVTAADGQTLSRSGVFQSRPLVNVGVLALLLLLAVLLALYLARGQVAATAERLLFAPALAQAGIGPAAPARQDLRGDGPVLSLEEYRRTIGTGVYTLSSQENGSVGTGGGAGGVSLSYEAMFREVAGQYGLDWRALAAQSYRESSFDAGAVGLAGEYGLMQIHPATWNEWAPLVGASNPWDPYENILVGTAYYSFLRSYFADNGYPDPKWATVAYNWGPERVLRLLDRNGRWSEIPLAQRMYTADILTGVQTVEARIRDFDKRNRAGQ